jgi:uncharacterized membrane protein
MNSNQTPSLSVLAEAPPISRGLQPRLDSIDLLRGLVMVLMALDHTRIYFSNAGFDPVDLSQTTSGYFLTRWITHFCAPTFVFLAGTAAFLSSTRGKSRRDLAWFLITRGLWLVFLEVTLIRFFWSFDLSYRGAGAAVIWALGWSMVVLAALIYWPRWLTAIFGVGMIALHHLLDGIEPEAFGRFFWFWHILHVPGEFKVTPNFWFGVGYPLIPWVGVMAAGYALGPVFLWEADRRRRFLLSLGAGVCLGFFLIRGTNVYGDPRPWSSQPSGLFTFYSILNCTKYPPSLSYLLMTLGPALLALVWFEKIKGGLAEVLILFGRVPMFFYLLHLPLIHFSGDMFKGMLQSDLAPESRAGWGLPVVYAAWIGIVLVLFPACRWFAGLKQRRRDAWLSYF